MGIKYDRRRSWKLGKQKAHSCYPDIKLEIEKAKSKNQGLSSKKIKKILNCAKYFTGCFASDQLDKLSISSFPIFIIGASSADCIAMENIIFSIFKLNFIFMMSRRAISSFSIRLSSDVIRS